MFLTTNRVTTFDEAMLSRVHFAIKYPDLTAKARKKLWKALLQKAGTSEEVDVNDTQLSSLTERKLNGRQVSGLALINAEAATDGLIDQEHSQDWASHG